LRLNKIHNILWRTNFPGEAHKLTFGIFVSFLTENFKQHFGSRLGII